MIASSRYLKDLEKRRSKIIHIYRNGDPYSRACFIILRLVEQKDMERIIKAVEEKVRLPQNRPIRKIFEISGTLVTSPSQIEDASYYVAASAEPFMSVDYGHALNWTLVGPVKTNKYANVRYVSRLEEEGVPVSKLSTSNSALTASHDQSKSTKPKSVSKKSRNVKSLKKKDKIIDKMSVSEHVEQAPSMAVESSELNDVPNDVNLTLNETDSNIDPMVNNHIGQSEKEEVEENGDVGELKANQYNSNLNEISKDYEEQNLTGANDEIKKDEYEEDISHNIDESNPGIPLGNDNLDEVNEVSDEVNEEKDNENSIKGDINEVEEKFGGVREEREEEEENISGGGDDEENAKENAATKIQASYRGYKVRSEMSKGDQVIDQESELEPIMDSLDDNTDALDDSSLCATDDA